MIQLRPLIVVFLSITFVLLIYIFITLAIKKKRSKRNKKWEETCDNLINDTLFLQENNDTEVPHHIERLLANKVFRTILIKKILLAVKSFSGHSVDQLKELYKTLHLDKYVVENLKSPFWHIRTRAIQEAGIMGLNDLYIKIEKFTHSRNPLTRAEAQISVIKLVGIDGLNFLNTIKYPISEWYQMILLKELSHFGYDSFDQISSWLKSTNESVVIFTLKLIENYHLFDHYTNTENCINNPNNNIRLQCIKSIAEIYNDETTNLLISRYDNEPFENKIAIIKVLQKIGTEKCIPFLEKELIKDNVQLKVLLMKTISKINPAEFELLSKKPNAQTYPLNEIITQIKEEANI